MDNLPMAKQMYDAYCNAVGGKAFNGDPLPGSEEFFNDPSKEKQSNAWIIAAQVAYNYIHGIAAGSGS